MAVIVRTHLRRDLNAMKADGFGFSLMVGIGETWLPAFVLAAGFGEFASGMIATVPILLGSVIQLLAPRILYAQHSYRNFVVAAAALQSLSMATICLLALQKDFPVWTVFAAATVYWSAGLATGPAWNAWAEYLVPQALRAAFFAVRSRLCHLGIAVGILLAGLLMDQDAQSSHNGRTFAVLFGVAAFARLFSAWMLSRQSATPIDDASSTSPPRQDLSSSTSLNTGTSAVNQALPTPSATEFATPAHRQNPSSQPDPNLVSSEPDQSPSPMRQIWQQVRHPNPTARFVWFLLAMQISVHVSGPWFTPYMLRVRQLEWTQYLLLIALGFLGKILSLRWAAGIANRLGTERLLWLGSIGIVPLSGLWMVSQSVAWLAVLQITSGMMWGCYELAMLLQFFRRIPHAQRVSVLTLYNLGNSLAMVAGSLIGGAVLTLLNRSPQSWLLIFVLSSVLRLCSLLLLPRRQANVLDTHTADLSPVPDATLSRTIAVRPMSGSVERPVFATISADKNVSAHEPTTQTTS